MFLKLKGKLEKAESLLNLMVLNKCVPNDVTFGTLVKRVLLSMVKLLMEKVCILFPHK